MKVRIWEQFSSNHSASFTVVGQFESSEQAERARAELTDILKQIEAGTLESPFSDEGEELTPTEIALRDKYKVDWPASVNWFSWWWKHDNLPIYKYNLLVSIRNPHPYIYTGPQPFNELMERLGGRVFLDVDVSQTFPQTALLVDFRLKLPKDEKQAKKLIQILEDDFENERLVSQGMVAPKKLETGLETYHFEWDYIEKPRILEIEHDNNYLHIFGLRFGYGLEAFAKFESHLKEFGCTEIEYTFHSERCNLPQHGDVQQQ